MPANHEAKTISYLHLPQVMEQILLDLDLSINPEEKRASIDEHIRSGKIAIDHLNPYVKQHDNPSLDSFFEEQMNHSTIPLFFRSAQIGPAELAVSPISTFDKKFKKTLALINAKKIRLKPEESTKTIHTLGSLLYSNYDLYREWLNFEASALQRPFEIGRCSTSEDIPLSLSADCVELHQGSIKCICTPNVQKNLGEKLGLLLKMGPSANLSLQQTAEMITYVAQYQTPNSTEYFASLLATPEV